MIVNLYIEIKRKNLMSEFERLVRLEHHLENEDMKFYNATDYDSCIGEPNGFNTIEEIKRAIEDPIVCIHKIPLDETCEECENAK